MQNSPSVANGSHRPPLSRAELAERLAEAEARITDLDICISSVTRIEGADGGLEPTPYRHDLRWAFKAPYGQRLYEELTGTLPWMKTLDGPEAVGHVRSMRAYNGRYSTLLSYGGGNEADSLAFPPTGNIYGGRHEAFDAALGGYGYVTFWSYGVPLSQVVRDDPADLRVDLVSLPDSGVAAYRVDVPWTETRCYQVFYLDPDRGFAVVRWEQIRSPKDRTPTLVVDRVKLGELAPGIWLATEASFRECRRDRSTVWCFTVSGARINAGLDDSLFTIAFPPRTQVIDRRTGRTYRMGRTSFGTLCWKLMGRLRGWRLRHRAPQASCGKVDCRR